MAVAVARALLESSPVQCPSEFRSARRTSAAPSRAAESMVRPRLEADAEDTSQELRVPPLRIRAGSRAQASLHPNQRLSKWRLRLIQR